MVYKMKKAMIYGAGALGRGHLALFFVKLGYEVSFVDNNLKIISELKKRNSYLTAQTINNKYVLNRVPYKHAYLFGEEREALTKTDIVLTAVGQRNIPKIAEKLRNVPVVFSFENDRSSTEELRKISRNKNCYFGIPDVIVSNYAPDELLEKDSLCLVSEEGEIILEAGDYNVSSMIKQVNEKEIRPYWACKFYLHNTVTFYHHKYRQIS
ncbi:hypothetical protein GMMP15_1320005 [Candidatus Magnetomoraceae bacterium gMMP-15]